MSRRHDPSAGGIWLAFLNMSGHPLVIADLAVALAELPVAIGLPVAAVMVIVSLMAAQVQDLSELPGPGVEIGLG